ncbi:transposase [Streptomyces sp. NPDC050418]|uniref:transposase n=1 Tax=Streptomyces sp. NPDC050418 TaxID=3365612 RepID=UPI0037AD2BDD
MLTGMIRVRHTLRLEPVSRRWFEQAVLLLEEILQETRTSGSDILLADGRVLPDIKLVDGKHLQAGAVYEATDAGQGRFVVREWSRTSGIRITLSSEQDGVHVAGDIALHSVVRPKVLEARGTTSGRGDGAWLAQGEGRACLRLDRWWRSVAGQPVSKAARFARRWAATGIIGIIRDQLRRRIRLAAGKTPQTASVIVDSQSIKASETASQEIRGWDGGKMINGRKRHLICDHHSLVLLVMVTPADAQGSLVARELLFRLAWMHPEIAIVWADSAYAKNGLIPWAKKYLDITVKAVRRPPNTKGFIVLPRGWAVERSW